jgi:hypothetical protein
VAEVAGELRDFATRWRTAGVEGWASTSYALDERGQVRPHDADRADGSSLLAYCADTYLPALALELEGRLCPICAEAEAARLGLLTKLIFLALVSAARSESMERPWEEFELARCAA